MTVDVGLFFDSVAAITKVRWTLPFGAGAERTSVMIGLGGVPFEVASTGRAPTRPTLRKMLTPAAINFSFITQLHVDGNA